jgi:hypothetical protein
MEPGRASEWGGSRTHNGVEGAQVADQEAAEIERRTARFAAIHRAFRNKHRRSKLFYKEEENTITVERQTHRATLSTSTRRLVDCRLSSSSHIGTPTLQRLRPMRP